MKFDTNEGNAGKSGWAVLHRTNRFKTKQEASTMAKLGIYKHIQQGIFYEIATTGTKYQ
jgi:hypothetical protein